MLPDNGGNGIPYLIVQGLTSVDKTIEYTLLAADVNGGRLGGPGGQDALAKGLAPRRSR